MVALLSASLITAFAESEPAFVTKPVGGYVAEGEKYTISWETNFDPVWMQILVFNSSGVPSRAIEVPDGATSFELDAYEYGYALEVYYTDNQCIGSEKFYIKEFKSTINSIEIEAPLPVAGATADLTGVKIKSANGDEALSGFFGFMANKLYWAKVPSLDPSDWGSDWSKFTGEFEEGEIYSLHFALQSEVALASSCAVTVSAPDGEVWWSGNIASQDGGFVVGDATIELEVPEAFVINSIEIDVGTSLFDDLPIIQSVNGNEEYKDYVAFSTIFESAWYVTEAPETEIDDPNVLSWEKMKSDEIPVDPWYDLQTHFVAQGGASFAENCLVTLTALTDREIASTELQSNSTMNYADIFLVPITIDCNDGSGNAFCDYAVFGEDYIVDFIERPFPKAGFIGVAFTPDATEGEMQFTIPGVKKSYTLYACYGELSTTIKSIEITSTVEIDPVIGEFPETNPGNFTVTKVNGDASLVNEIDEIYLYWNFSDTNDPESYNWLYNPGDKKFLGGYYYEFNIDFTIAELSDYIFGEDVEVTLITPTKTIKSAYSSAQSDHYVEVYWTFDHKTEGEPLKYIGDTTVSISGYEPGATAGEVAIMIQGEGTKFVNLYGTTYYFYNYTDDDYLEANDTFEEGKSYSLGFDLYCQPGYTVADFTLNYLNITMNGFTPSYADYDFDAGNEYVDLEFILPLFEGTEKVSAPTMSFENYEIGHKFEDVTFNFSGNGLSVDTTYGMGYCAGDGYIWFIDAPFGESDSVIEKDEKYVFAVRMFVTEGYGIDGITKEMFVLNGITPYALSVGRDYDNECLIVVATYELPVLHEEEEGWHYDATHHWGECECGERINIEAHECTDGTGKCDMCGYAMYEPTPGTTPGATPGTPTDTTPESGDTTDLDKKDGLGAGAIVGIVAGALVLLGGGGFAIFWFVIEKKSFADLLALVKKNTNIVRKEATSKEEGTSKEEASSDKNSEE